MKPGDLVKMKNVMWWKGNRSSFVSRPAIVLARAHNAVRLLLPDGKIRMDVAQNWEVINES